MKRFAKQRAYIGVALVPSVLFLLAGCAGVPVVINSASGMGEVPTTAVAAAQLEDPGLETQMADLKAQLEELQRLQENDALLSTPGSMGQMAEMVARMQTVMGALPDSDSAGQMGPQMMGMLSGVMGMTQSIVDDIQAMPMDEGQMQLMGQMMGMMSQMIGMMGQMQGMMGGDMGMITADSPADVRKGATTPRQAEVAKLGTQVMPFDLEQTIHVFKVMDNGGVQQVLVQEGAGADQVAAIQMHLLEEAERFGQGDFGDPGQIHGEDMPGLAVLRQRVRDLEVLYSALDDGAQLEYISDNPEVVTAIHDWFGAQLADHGAHATDAMPVGDITQMQGMMGSGTGATIPITSTMPMGSDMAHMMGMMSQMMGQMQGMMGSGMGATTPLTSTMPMDGNGSPVQEPDTESSDSATGGAVTREKSITPEELVQEAPLGALTVKVTPLNLLDAEAALLDFEIAFDTHSIELNFDFAELITLNVDGTEIAADSWNAPSRGGHHTSGILSFPAVGSDGKSLLADATSVSLVLQDIGVSGGYTFTWNLRAE